jgi:S-adenosylmethionine:tRNA ribosyltransferase-isomerase
MITMKTSDFDYHLPPQMIAQTPLEPRDSSRLMLMDRTTGRLEHHRFYNLTDFLREGDVLVFNDSRVIPARLFGFLDNSKTEVELLLLRRREKNIWEALAKPGRKIRSGSQIRLDKDSSARGEQIDILVLEQKDNGMRILQFYNESLISQIGHMPLPPYIHTQLQDPGRYQTIFARNAGSAAAPTAGLHFTIELLDRLNTKKVQMVFVTLHIGLDTFQPVRTENPSEHKIHTEYGELSAQTADLLNKAKKNGHRIIAVGTSSVRILEAAWEKNRFNPSLGDISLFILPGHEFRAIDGMITNFHLPKSTLLMLVSAFAGREQILQAYVTAMQSGYRFYSFGDAMLIL